MAPSILSEKAIDDLCTFQIVFASEPNSQRSVQLFNSFRVEFVNCEGLSITFFYIGTGVFFNGWYAPKLERASLDFPNDDFRGLRERILTIFMLQLF